MENNTAIVQFVITRRNKSVDLEIPLDISANDLVVALSTAYNLGINTANIRETFLISENPIALLRGSKSLFEFGIRNGSILYFNK